MKFGLLVPPGAHMIKHMIQADERGFDSAFVLDSPVIFSDPYVFMAAVAGQTKRIMLSTGVTNPLTRSAPVTASNLASLNALAPGRIALGIGVGNTANMAMGQQNAKLEDLDRFVGNMRQMLSGEVAEVDLLGEDVFVQFLNQEGGWINIKDSIPIYVAASRPKILQMAGRIADAVILGGIANVDVIDACRSHLEQGAKSVGRSVDDIEICITPSVYISDKEPTHEQLRSIIGPKSLSPAMNFSFMAEQSPGVAEHVKADLIKARGAFKPPVADENEDPRKKHLKAYKGYVTELQEWQKPFVTEHVLEATSIAGTPEQCYEKIKRLQEHGVKHILLSPNPNEMESTIKEYADKIFPLFKK